MTKSFSFYLYSKHKAERLVFSSDDWTFMSELSGLINRLPKAEGVRKLDTLPNTSAGFLQLNGILGKQGASFSWENLRE